MDSLHTITLVDGMPVHTEGKAIKYRTMHLREAWRGHAGISHRPPCVETSLNAKF